MAIGLAKSLTTGYVHPGATRECMPYFPARQLFQQAVKSVLLLGRKALGCVSNRKASGILEVLDYSFLEAAMGDQVLSRWFQGDNKVLQTWGFLISDLS